MAATNLELTIATELSKKPSLEPLDSTALTEAQQQKLNDHKVRLQDVNKYNVMHLTSISNSIIANCPTLLGTVMQFIQISYCPTFHYYIPGLPPPFF